MKKQVLGACITLLLASVAFLGEAPGTAENPLLSRKYGDALYLFHIYTFPAGSAVTLDGGAELVLRAGGGEAQKNLLNLTRGRDERGVLAPNQHYLCVRGPVTVKFLKPSVLLLRGRFYP